MMELAVQSTLLFAFAALGNLLLRHASAARRHAVWMLAFVAVPIVALLPRWTTPAIAMIPVDAIAAASTQVAISAFPWASAIWFTGAALFLIRLAFSFGWMYARRGKLTAPVTFGVLRPEILLPAAAASWPETLRASVEGHEQAHIQRRDTVAQLFTQVVCAVLWFQPLAWYAARRAAEERERACDDLVLTSGVDAAQYASHLLAIARESMDAPVAALPMARPSTLESRIGAVLSESVERGPVTQRWRFGMIAVAALAIAGASGVRAQGEPVYQASDPGITGPKVAHKVEPQYTEEARDNAISGTVVLSIEIDAGGMPRNVEVVKSLDKGLDANAVAAMYEWRFDPATKDGKPVTVAAKVEINFRLQ